MRNFKYNISRPMALTLLIIGWLTGSLNELLPWILLFMLINFNVGKENNNERIS
jgi:hypothetical protein